MSRIAAYCGTRNIYSDMITSAKSLIANSPVEEVHMFIEDDDMEEELPNIIICHNVSNQTYFSEDSPNIDSSNDYMLMMYAALSNELNNNTVLALTANAIVQDDISEI